MLWCYNYVPFYPDPFAEKVINSYLSIIGAFSVYYSKSLALVVVCEYDSSGLGTQRVLALRWHPVMLHTGGKVVHNCNWCFFIKIYIHIPCIYLYIYIYLNLLYSLLMPTNLNLSNVNGLTVVRGRISLS